MFRISSFLDTDTTIDSEGNNYFVLDSPYSFPVANVVNFLLDPNVNIIVNSTFESLDNFSTSSILFQKVYYEFSSAFNFLTTLNTIKVKDSLICLDDFYKVTSPLECFERFQINNFYEFLDNEAFIIKNGLDIFTNGLLVKNFCSSLDPYTVFVTDTIELTDTYVNPVFSFLDSLYDCKNTVSAELAVLEDFVDRVPVSKAFEFLQDSKVTPPFSITMTN
jgi:hypothetical protein